MSKPSSSQRRLRRRRRVRAKVKGTAERPRISVFRSHRGVSAQAIDDRKGHTMAAVNWTEADLCKLTSSERAARAGKLLAARMKEQGITAVVFDRGGYQYHGQVKKLADGVREGGLEL